MRTRMLRFIPAFAVCLSLAVAAACGERASGGTSAVSVTDVELGRSLKPDMTIGDKTDSFHATDVVYVTVATKGTGPATLKARWVFEDNQFVAEDTQELSPTGPARTEFHLSKPTGLASGRYKVEIFLNDTSVGTKTFEVN